MIPINFSTENSREKFLRWLIASGIEVEPGKKNDIINIKNTEYEVLFSCSSYSANVPTLISCIDTILAKYPKSPQFLHNDIEFLVKNIILNDTIPVHTNTPALENGNEAIVINNGNYLNKHPECGIGHCFPLGTKVKKIKNDNLFSSLLNNTEQYVSPKHLIPCKLFDIYAEYFPPKTKLINFPDKWCIKGNKNKSYLQIIKKLPGGKRLSGDVDNYYYYLAEDEIIEYCSVIPQGYTEIPPSDFIERFKHLLDEEQPNKNVEIPNNWYVMGNSNKIYMQIMEKLSEGKYHGEVSYFAYYSENGKIKATASYEIPATHIQITPQDFIERFKHLLNETTETIPQPQKDLLWCIKGVDKNATLMQIIQKISRFNGNSSNYYGPRNDETKDIGIFENIPPTHKEISKEEFIAMFSHLLVCDIQTTPSITETESTLKIPQETTIKLDIHE